MKKILFITLLIIVLLEINLFSQDYEPVNLNFVPPSPNALSFMKFGNIPVSPYSGIPSVEIPLYEYNGNYLNLPISLKYHGGGIRVEEIASNVGLGWALLAGGSVSRTVRGLADDMATYGYLYADEIQNCFDLLTYGDPTSKCYKYYKGIEDSEQDIFYVNAGNLSFSFTINKEGVVLTDPQSKVKIEKTLGSFGDIVSYGNITEWIITDENGSKYIFNVKEFTKATSSSSYFEPHPLKYIVTSWYLTQIIAPFSFETINFEYDQYTYKYVLSMSESIVADDYNSTIYLQAYSGIDMIAQRIKRIITPTATIIFNYDESGYRCDLKGDAALTNISINSTTKTTKSFNFVYKYMISNGFNDYSTCTNEGEHQLGKRLILWTLTESGKNPYEFIYNPGLPSRDSKSQDHWGFYNGKSNTTLIPKTYFTCSNNSNDIIELGDADRRVDPDYSKCGSLSKIIYPTGGCTSLEYEVNEATDKFLEYSLVNMNYSLDGTSNLSRSITIEREQIPHSKLTFKMMIMTPSFLDGSCGIRALIKDGTQTLYSVDFTKAEFYQGISKEIDADLDDGNYEFTFEIFGGSSCPDPVQDPFDLRLLYENETVDNNKYAGGLRIKKITDAPDQITNDNEIIKWYEYNTQSGSSSGYILQHPIYLTISNYGGQCHFASLTSSSNTFLGQTKGSSVGYSRVMEHFGLNNEDGYIEYKYTSPNDYLDDYGFSKHIPEFPYPPASSFENCRGLLTEKVLCNSEGHKVEQILNTYDISYTWDDSLSNIKVGSDLGYKSSLPESIRNFDRLLGVIYSNYQVKANLSSNRSKKWFSTTDSIETITNLTYSQENNKLIKKETSPLSDGDILVERFYYPQNFNSGVSTAIDLLSTSNNLNEVLINESWKGTDENNLSLTGTTVKIFKTIGSDKAVLDEVYSLQSNSPVSKAEMLEFNPNIILRKPEYYQLDVKIIQSDSHNNVLEYLKNDGMPVSFFWGYSKIYPVASFGNMSYSVIEANTNGLTTELEKLDDYTVLTDPAVCTQLKALNNLIRTLTPSGALVTTYTYDPLIGMTSQTDPNGVTTYYEYDSFGRLKCIKDDDGRILKTYEYHYTQ